MSEEKVVFDRHGDYQFGTPLQEMDVQNEGQPAPPKTLHATFYVPPSPQRATPTKKFDLSSLRQKVNTPAPAPVVETAEPTPAAPEVEEPKPSGVVKVEEQKDGFLQNLPEVPDPEEVQPSIEEPPVQEEPQAEEEPAISAAPVQAAPHAPLSLAQIGLARKTSETVARPIPVASAPALESEAVKEMHFDLPEVPDPEEGFEKASSGPVEKFEVVSLSTMLALVHGGEDDLRTFLNKVLKERVRSTTAIFESESLKGLRVYSITLLASAHGNVYAAMGFDKKITACIYNGNRGLMVDASKEITISGSCAVIADVPVANCGQRKVEALML